ncbi:MAG: hypothetical protein V1792_09905 [Pseudomonadota bacterium]
MYNLKDHNGRELGFNRSYETILEFNKIPHCRLNVSDRDFWKKIASLTLFIMRAINQDSHHLIGRDLLPVVESHYGINCYPDQKTYWHYDDKVKQFLLMKTYGFPMTQCFVFYERDKALDWMAGCNLPKVFKLRAGAGSNNVILIRKRREGYRLINKMFGKGLQENRLLFRGSVRHDHFNILNELHRIGGNMYRWFSKIDTDPHWAIHKNYALFQKFLPNNNCDTRITVIGNRAFGFRRMNREIDFRASGSGRLDYDVKNIDLRCVEIAHQVSAQCEFQSMAYDFLCNEDGNPEFCEISYDYLSEPIYRCPGYWDRRLNWHQGNWRPELLHLQDCLKCPDLKSA